MSNNPALPLVSIALVAAARNTRRTADSAPSSNARKAVRVRPLIRAWQRSLVSLWMQYLAWQARRDMRKLLHSLDDRTLRDIGITRSEIETAVSDIRWPRPPRHA